MKKIIRIAELMHRGTFIAFNLWVLASWADVVINNVQQPQFAAWNFFWMIVQARG